MQPCLEVDVAFARRRIGRPASVSCTPRPRVKRADLRDLHAGRARRRQQRTRLRGGTAITSS